MKEADQKRLDKRIPNRLKHRPDEQPGEKPLRARESHSVRLVNGIICDRSELILEKDRFHTIYALLDDTGTLVSSTGTGHFLCERARLLAHGALMPVFLKEKRQNENFAKQRLPKKLGHHETMENIRYIFREATRSHRNDTEGLPGWSKKNKMFATWLQDSKDTLSPAALLEFARRENFEWTDPSHLPLDSRRRFLGTPSLLTKVYQRLDQRNQDLPNPYVRYPNVVAARHSPPQDPGDVPQQSQNESAAEQS